MMETGAQGMRLSGLVSVGLGIVLSQCTIVAVLQLTGTGGVWFFAALAVALIAALCYADSFAELALMMPRSGGLGRYTEVALGPFPAIVATFAGSVVVAIFGTAAELLLVDAVARRLLGWEVPPLSIAAGVLAAATLLNIFGMDLFARLQTGLMALKVGAMLVLGGLAWFFAGRHIGLNVGAAPVGASVSVAQLVPLAAAVIWGLMGAEYICPMIEMAKRPARDVPRAMFATLLLTALVYVVFCSGALVLLPRVELEGAALPHLVMAERMTGRWGGVLVALAALTASLGLVNGVLAAVPRLLHGMAVQGQAFGVFKRLHRKHGTPWVAVLFLSAATATVLASAGRNERAFTVLVLSATASWFLAYIVAHVDVIVLRRRYPAADRPYRSPWFPWPQLAGAVAMAVFLFYLSPDPSMTEAIAWHAGAVLLVVALTAAAWVKGIQRRGLFAKAPLNSENDHERSTH